jgi:nitrite reductase (NO-forming)
MNAKRPSKAYPSKRPAPQPSRNMKRVVPALLIVLLLIAAALAAAFGSPGSKEPVREVSVPKARELSLDLGDMFVEPRTVSITEGDSLKLVVRNKGKVNHDLIFSNGKGIRQLKPGEQDTIDFGVPEGSLTAICSLPGHAAAGMKFSIYVTEA